MMRCLCSSQTCEVSKIFVGHVKYRDNILCDFCLFSLTHCSTQLLDAQHLIFAYSALFDFNEEKRKKEEYSLYNDMQRFFHNLALLLSLDRLSTKAHAIVKTQNIYACSAPFVSPDESSNMT